MEQSLTEELNSMMQSVSKNIGLYDLTAQPLYTSRNSQIFHIANRNDRKSHALKTIFRRGGKSEEAVRAAYQKERKIHQSLKNRYIVQLENAFMDENNFFLVLEYCAKGNLRSFMKEKQTIETIKQFALQIAKGLTYLHKSKIAHGNLKPQNILLTAQREIKICDFGESFKFYEKVRDKMRGDFLYAPPEAIQNANQNRDIWSFGCILYEMVTGKVPFDINSWKELAITLTPQFLKNFSYPNTISPTLLHLFKQIFVHDYTKRLKIQQILMHPFFTNEPLVNTLITQKSEEIKERKPKTSRSKQTFRSLQLKQSTKQNKNTMNVNANNQPDYKKLLDKKFKEEKSRGTSKQNSDHKANNKLIDEGGRSGKTQLTYNVIKSAFQSRKAILSPLKTQGMIMKEIQKKKNKIMIDKEGFTRCGQTDWMNISCDGKIIRLRKNGAEKKYNFESLPEKYYDMYEQAKKIVKEAKSWTPRMSYKDQQLDLSIMYSGSISVKFSNGPEYKDIQLQKILKNGLNLDEQRVSFLQKVTLALMSIQRK